MSSSVLKYFFFNFFNVIDISPHHVEGKLLDKTVWSLLNFHAFVKHHVKVTKIQ